VPSRAITERLGWFCLSSAFAAAYCVGVELNIGSKLLQPECQAAGRRQSGRRAWSSADSQALRVMNGSQLQDGCSPLSRDR
jgi:hypothetical protein